MHPEIKKFWESSGYKIVSYQDPRKVWEAVRSYYQNNDFLVYERFVVACHIQLNTISYRFNDQSYSEKEMLSMVKMKAFL